MEIIVSVDRMNKPLYHVLHLPKPHLWFRKHLHIFLSKIYSRKATMEALLEIILSVDRMDRALSPLPSSIKASFMAQKIPI